MDKGTNGTTVRSWGEDWKKWTISQPKLRGRFELFRFLALTKVIYGLVVLFVKISCIWKCEFSDV